MRITRLEVFGFKSFLDRLVLPLEGFSRLPFFKKEEASDLVLTIQKMGLKVSLEWDILMTDKVLQKIVQENELSFFSQFFYKSFQARKCNFKII